MIESFFRGKEADLFDGTAIDKWGNLIFEDIPTCYKDTTKIGKWVEYPVVHRDFSAFMPAGLTSENDETLKIFKGNSNDKIIGMAKKKISEI